MSEYLLSSSDELNRLQLQARVWEPETNGLFAEIGVQTGWSCVDLGCGAMGVLGPLSRRVSPTGRVTGVDQDATLLQAAQRYLEQEQLTNVELRQGDVHRTGLSPASFDLVHERFVLPHVPDPEAFIRDMVALAKPGGIIVLQEPDHSSWRFHPHCPSWPRLLEILETVLALRGDINIGRRTYHLLREAGLENVQLRAGVVGLGSRHPYMKMPLVGMEAMRRTIVEASIATADELDALARDVHACCEDEGRMMISFTTTQVWGRKPH